MEKYNWKEDMELYLALSESPAVPKAVPRPLFYSQYRFIIRRYTCFRTEVKKFVPEWALKVVCDMLDNDETVRSYFYVRTFKGNVKVPKSQLPSDFRY